MVYVLADNFEECYLEGTGYFLGVEPCPEWIKEKGTKSFEEKYRPIEVYLSFDDYDEDNEVFSIYLDAFSEDIDIPASILKDENDEWELDEVEYEPEGYNIKLILILDEDLDDYYDDSEDYDEDDDEDDE